VAKIFGSDAFSPQQIVDKVEATATIDVATLHWSGFAGNLIPVTLGNIIGGSVMVALVYYTIYRRGLKS